MQPFNRAQRRAALKSIRERFGDNSTSLTSSFRKHVLNSEKIKFLPDLSLDTLNELVRFFSISQSLAGTKSYQPSANLTEDEQASFIQLITTLSDQTDEAYEANINGLKFYICKLIDRLFALDTKVSATHWLINLSNEVHLALLKLSAVIGYDRWDKPEPGNGNTTLLHTKLYGRPSLPSNAHDLDIDTNFFTQLATISIAGELQIDWNAQDDSNNSIISLLLLHPNPEYTRAAIELIKAHSKLEINLNQRNSKGTLLHKALLSGNKEAYEALLAEGANTQIKDSNNRTVVDYFVERDFIIKDKIKSTLLYKRQPEDTDKAYSGFLEIKGRYTSALAQPSHSSNPYTVFHQPSSEDHDTTTSSAKRARR